MRSLGHLGYSHVSTVVEKDVQHLSVLFISTGEKHKQPGRFFNRPKCQHYIHKQELALAVPFFLLEAGKRAKPLGCWQERHPCHVASRRG